MTKEKTIHKKPTHVNIPTSTFFTKKWLKYFCKECCKQLDANKFEIHKCKKCGNYFCSEHFDVDVCFECKNSIMNI